MVNITINNIPVTVEDGITIMEACKEAKMPVPSLCYLKGINEIGACRVCVVEIKGVNKLIPACNNVVQEGMDIYTNSPRVREARRTNVELILSQHDCLCATCVRSGNCSLQKIANDLGIISTEYHKNLPANTWPASFPLIRDASKCIKCMRCIQICDKVQGLNIWDVAKTGSRTTVGVSHNQNITESDCSLCGQCITHCPVGALRERDDSHRLLSLGGAFNDPDKVTIVQIAPAVRTAWGEELGLTREEATPGRLVSALKALGFDYVFDTNYGADLTIMEEGSEFLERMKHRDQYTFPMFTSCCPGWVRFLKARHPEMAGQLSTAKSPHQMQGAITKTYFAEKMGIDPDKIFNISIMPCVAKKHEADIPNINDAGHGKDVDMVLTTREVVRMIRADHLDVKNLPESEFDTPLGTGTGAAVIFGATGGVMEAALRTAVELVTGESAPSVDYHDVRGTAGIKEATYEVGGLKLNVCVASGLSNCDAVLKAVKSGEKHYDFIEFMACPGGCVNGGGQPTQPASVRNFVDLKSLRAKALYSEDEAKVIRKSHENPLMKKIYAEYLGEPGGEKAHHILHTSYVKREKLF